VSVTAQSFLEKIALQKADQVIVPSRYAKLKVMEYYGIKGERIRVIPSTFDENAWQKSFSKVKKIKSDKKLILTVAKMYKRKNIQALIRAFQIVQNKIQNVQLWIVGSGPELENLKKLAQKLNLEKDIYFWGEISDKLKKRIYKSVDIFCLPTLQEIFGFVFLEAFASRKPVVSTKLAAVPEIVKNNVSGLLTDPDPNSLAFKITNLLSNKKLKNRLIQNGSLEAKKYTYLKVYQNFNQLIKLLSV
jgi:glycosyltransferase involved in cell wall biosynthesis